MHDAFGRELKPGDTVMMPFIITEIYSSIDFCNCDLKSVATMPGNDTHTTLSAVNTRQVLRAKPEDDLKFNTMRENLSGTKLIP